MNSFESIQHGILINQQKLKELLQNSSVMEFNDSWDLIDNRHEIHRQCVTLYRTASGYITGIAAWKGGVYDQMANSKAEHLYEDFIAEDDAGNIFRLYLFPEDPLLPDLKKAVSPCMYLEKTYWNSQNDTSNLHDTSESFSILDKENRISIALLRYRPCLSCTLKITRNGYGPGEKNIISKVYPKKNLLIHVFQIMKQLWHTQKTVGSSYFAKPIAAIPEAHILIQETLPGKNLEILLEKLLYEKRTSYDEIFVIMENCGRAIQVVHESNIRVEKQRPLLSELNELSKKSADIHCYNNNMGEKLLELTALLKKTSPSIESPEKYVLTHGDYKPGQILVNDLNVHLLDFDNAALSLPAFDFGTFVATLKQTYIKSLIHTKIAHDYWRKQVVERLIQSFIAGYYEKTQIPGGTIAWCVSLALLRKAIREFYKDHGSKMIVPQVQEAILSLENMDYGKIYLQ